MKPMVTLNEFWKPVITILPNFETSKIDEYKIFSDSPLSESSEGWPDGLLKNQPQTFENAENRFSNGELRNVSIFENTKLNVCPTFSNGELRNVFILKITKENVWPTFENTELRSVSILENTKVNVCPTFENAKLNGELRNVHIVENTKLNVWPTFENRELNVCPMFEIVELNFCSTFKMTSLTFESKIARLNSKSNGMAKMRIIPRHEFSWVTLILVSFSVHTPIGEKRNVWIIN